MDLARPFTVLDGGLSTALELAGHDLHHDLWTARLLLDHPAAVVDAHLAYLRAGAEVVITASYQASISGFHAAGQSRIEATALIGLTTELARTAVTRHRAETADRGRTPLVAASVGPYGAVLADGSEYRGDYPIGPGLLRDFHAERLEILITSAPDLLAIETIPSALEAAVIVEALARLTGPPAWLTFSCRDGGHTSAGDPIEDAVSAVADAPGIHAIGVNCTAPGHVGELLERIATVTDLPLVAYANSGQRWEAATGCWVGDPDDSPALDELVRWVEAGARVIGGCCGVGPLGIATLRTRRDEWPDGPDAGGAAVA